MKLESLKLFIIRLVHKFRVLVFRYRFIYRLPFLFDVQFVVLEFHIEVLSFEDEEWSRGR